MARSLDIPAAAGTIDALIFTPKGQHGPRPGVILFTDIGGLRTCYEEKAQRIADDGYAVLMPNIYWRRARGRVVPAGKGFRDPDVRTVTQAYAEDLTPAALAGDFAALLAALDAEPEFAAGGMAAIGYCLTGGFPLRMAAAFPDRVRAAAGFHSARLAPEGDADSPASVARSVRARVYFGHADQDDFLPADQIARLDGALAAAGVHFQTELFAGAHHGWTATDAPSYDAAADALHYRRIRTLLDETVGG